MEAVVAHDTPFHLALSTALPTRASVSEPTMSADTVVDLKFASTASRGEVPKTLSELTLAYGSKALELAPPTHGPHEGSEHGMRNTTNTSPNGSDNDTHDESSTISSSSAAGPSRSGARAPGIRAALAADVLTRNMHCCPLVGLMSWALAQCSRSLPPQ